MPPAGTLEIDGLDDRSLAVVAERDVLEHELPGAGWELERAGAICDLLGLVEDLEDTPPRGDRPLRLPDPHPEHPQRHHEHGEQEVEAEERPERERSGDDHPTRGEQHERLSDERQEREQRHVERALPVGVDRPLEDGVRCGIEVRGPPLLLRERLDDVDARDRLLGDDRDLGEGLLDVAQDGLRNAAVAVGGQRDDRCDRQRDERELASCRRRAPP